MPQILNVCALFFVTLVASTLAFQCYVCNSKNNSDCGSPPKEKYLKTCEDIKYANRNSQPFTVCRLQVIASETDGTIYDRRCGWIKQNENRETCLLTTDPLLKATNCECHTDRCNGSFPSTGPASVALFVATLFFIFLMRH